MPELINYLPKVEEAKRCIKDIKVRIEDLKKKRQKKSIPKLQTLEELLKEVEVLLFEQGYPNRETATESAQSSITLIRSQLEKARTDLHKKNADEALFNTAEFQLPIERYIRDTLRILFDEFDSLLKTCCEALCGSEEQAKKAGAFLEKVKKPPLPRLSPPPHQAQDIASEFKKMLQAAREKKIQPDTLVAAFYDFLNHQHSPTPSDWNKSFEEHCGIYRTTGDALIAANLLHEFYSYCHLLVGAENVSRLRDFLLVLCSENYLTCLKQEKIITTDISDHDAALRISMLIETMCSTHTADEILNMVTAVTPWLDPEDREAITLRSSRFLRSSGFVEPLRQCVVTNLSEDTKNKLDAIESSIMKAIVDRFALSILTSESTKPADSAVKPSEIKFFQPAQKEKPVAVVLPQRRLQP